MGARKKQKTITVTGATGFLGKHVLAHLKLLDGYHVIATGRNASKLKKLNTPYIVCDIKDPGPSIYHQLGEPDYVIHLAWEGLPHYQERYHFEENLQVQYRFLKGLIQRGLKNLTVAGSCLEYGLQNGCLSEKSYVNPSTCYGIAKDSLRRFLETLQHQFPFRLTWARLFYMFGKGQNPNSLMASLNRAIDNGDAVFNMSEGEQLRDYLPVEKAAQRIVQIALNPMADGTVNICSGNPISIRKLVEQHLEQRKANLRLNFGHHPMPSYEPVAFWGDPQRQNKILKL